MFTRLIAALGLLAVVHSLDVEPPFSHEKNTWYIADLRLSYIVNSLGGVNATFSFIGRTSLNASQRNKFHCRNSCYVAR
jgi:hypothetical protein